jgi:ribosome-binding protein aMBF1 (putative translation factor)
MPIHLTTFFLPFTFPPLAKHLFMLIKDYPISRRNFDEKLRKARMDAGFQIRNLAHILGVSEDTVINGEVSIAPTSRNFEKV